MAKKNPPTPAPVMDQIAGAEAALSSVATEGDPIVTAFQVRAKRAGFRRAGRAWSTEWETVAADELTDDQVVAMLSEPMLAVVAIAAIAGDK